MKLVDNFKNYEKILNDAQEDINFCMSIWKDNGKTPPSDHCISEIIKAFMGNALNIKKPKRWSKYLTSKGIKCDSCDWSYREEDINKKNLYLWVNISCPVCGEILLTEEDWKYVKILNSVLLFPPIAFLNWVGSKFGKLGRFKVSMDGTGVGTKIEKLNNNS